MRTAPTRFQTICPKAPAYAGCRHLNSNGSQSAVHAFADANRLPVTPVGGLRCLVGWLIGWFRSIWFGLAGFANAKVLPQNWLSLRTSCGGVLPQEGWCNVEALTYAAIPAQEDWRSDSREVYAPFTVVNACPCDVLCQSLSHLLRVLFNASLAFRHGMGRGSTRPSHEGKWARHRWHPVSAAADEAVIKPSRSARRCQCASLDCCCAAGALES